MTANSEIIIAGHVCLDLIPEFPADTNPNLTKPGKLLTIGRVHYSTGGVVSNVGIALHKLGLTPRLIGKVGNDLFGRTIIEYFQSFDAALSQNIIVSGKDSTSYTIVVNPPGRDRTYWHHPGCNDSFGADDIGLPDLYGARLFHFGYPPIMKRMYNNDGAELVEIFRKVKKAGLITSLDMASIDPNSPAEKADWNKILEALLPYVDIFLPSLDEILYMTKAQSLDQLSGTSSTINEQILNTISSNLIKRGAAIVGLKLGSDGFYLRTTLDQWRLASFIQNAASWAGRELLSPCFMVKEMGTTGSGDCTIAGFLAAFLNGLSPSQAINSAVGAGACSIEALDATTGIPD
ncbi:MAG: carbohydrate kinase family protein [Candidatus Marinimicrobia bacterium CG08_land_8_20_14_0_20_45_22]|nr:MAG: carbohydrate kinase family protein [Candidatus Marinimicrobia bacterium CG08_land_8_20_14_0_20_45_22]